MRLVADSACDIKELRGMVFKAVPLTISTECLIFLKNIRDVHILRALE